MDTHDETPGERAVKAELNHLKLKFKQEKTIKGLKADSKSSRVADFYLPKHDIYLEFLGDWNNPREKFRYEEKMRVYKLNNIKCIWIYPGQLTHTSKIIQDGLINYGVSFQNNRNSKPKTKAPKSKPEHYVSILPVEKLKPLKNKIPFSKIVFFALIIILSILLILILVAKNMDKNKLNQVSKSQVSDKFLDVKYNQTYSNLTLGMSVKNIWTMLFNKGFLWEPNLGESKEFVLHWSPLDKSRIKIYFDDIAQKKVKNTGIIVSEGGIVRSFEFTDAKFIKVELYYNGKKIAEK